MTDQPQISAEKPSEAPASHAAPALEAEAIAAYLRDHPAFFVEHEELLPALRIPHQRGDTVSLVERQLKLLRDRNIEMRHRLSQLMDVARQSLEARQIAERETTAIDVQAELVAESDAAAAPTPDIVGKAS